MPKSPSAERRLNVETYLSERRLSVASSLIEAAFPSKPSTTVREVADSKEARSPVSNRR